MQPLLQYKSNKYYIPWEYVLVVLGTQHEMHMCHIVICGLYGSTIFFHIISQTAQFKKKITKHKTCVLIFSRVLSKTFLILVTNEPDMIKMYTGLHVKYLFLVRFQWNLNFLNRFLKNTKISHFTKICPVQGQLSHEERQTEMTMLILAFHNFVNMP